jgi:hypothetical protein
MALGWRPPTALRRVRDRMFELELLTLSSRPLRDRMSVQTLLEGDRPQLGAGVADDLAAQLCGRDADLPSVAAVFRARDTSLCESGASCPARISAA